MIFCKRAQKGSERRVPSMIAPFPDVFELSRQGLMYHVRAKGQIKALQWLYGWKFQSFGL